ncbi:MAG: methylamine utilization protein [Gemmatimonadales bacterium]
MDAGGHTAADVGDAVLWIEGRGPRASAARVDMALDARQFHPRVIVVPVGSTVNFPNQDPFNHNVFSLSDPNSFDLGLYGQRETHEKRFTHPGLVRVYCNIHPRMTGFVIVRDNSWYTKPELDGSFTIENVPPGSYTLKVWHERASEFSQAITVPAGGLAGVEITMDASGYRYVQHKNKYGQEYGTGATRERY